MCRAHVKHNLRFSRPSLFSTRNASLRIWWDVILGKWHGPSYTGIYINISCFITSVIFRTFVKFNIFFRRKHKKGQEEEQTKKRTRRAQKFQRAIVGASLTDILAKRNMKPEIRKAQREQAIKYVPFELYLFNY